MRIQLLVFLFILAPALAFADGYERSPRAQMNPPERAPKSENFDKTKRFLPGEEVVSPTGQKMKVWSTRGPVEVSPPPQPFEDREKALLPDQVIVDTGAIVGRRRDRGVAGDGGFDLRQPPSSSGQ